jgi:catechol 2,3-dioxygenase-like lactoylglutathione lyase family enzyme
MEGATSVAPKPGGRDFSHAAVCSDSCDTTIKEADMESVIAGMLEQFETGKISRRQLIERLAMAALAAPAATAAAQTAPAKAPWKTVCLDHISFAVADYRKSAAFYQSLMGWELRNDNGTNQATLAIPNVGDIIVRNRRPPAAGTDAAAQPAPAGRPPVTGVINHISYGVEPWNSDAVEAELKRRGLNPRPDMVGENFKSFHVLDPDGWDLQISNATRAR